MLCFELYFVLNLIKMPSCGTMPKLLTATKVDLNRTHMKVKKVGKDYEFNDFTCRPCEGLNRTSCRFKCMIQNHKGLRFIKESASSFLKFLHRKVLFFSLRGLTVPRTTLLCSAMVNFMVGEPRCVTLNLLSSSHHTCYCFAWLFSMK